MTEQINDLLDAQVSLNRLIWILDDETYETLFELTRQHLALVKEAMESTTTHERKVVIKQEIDRLRTERDFIITKFQKTL